jgi:hypothetical protein
LLMAAKSGRTASSLEPAMIFCMPAHGDDTNRQQMRTSESFHRTWVNRSQLNRRPVCAPARTRKGMGMCSCWSLAFHSPETSSWSCGAQAWRRQQCSPVTPTEKMTASASYTVSSPSLFLATTRDAAPVT